MQANRKLNEELQAYTNKIANLEHQLEKDRQISAPAQTPVQLRLKHQLKLSPFQSKHTKIPFNMSKWISVEENLYADSVQQTGGQNPKEFYDQQKEKALYYPGCHRRL